MEQTDDFRDQSYSPFSWSGAKRNICRIRRIRSNKTIGESHEDDLQRGNLITENAEVVIVSSNKFKIGHGQVIDICRL
jgi:hypothetical protein